MIKKNKINNLVIAIMILHLLACKTKGLEIIDASSQKQPNVLFISVDDLNSWLGCINRFSNTKTPNIDKLASEGILFTNAHCQAPLCGPSRASIMSGLRPSTTGIYGMISDDEIRSNNPATKEIIFLHEYFKNNGYHTMGVGKIFHQHAPKSTFEESGGRVSGFGPNPQKRFVWDGWGTADKTKYERTSTDWGAYPSSDTLMPDHGSANWAIDRLETQYSKPFFLALGFLRPHVPLYVPQKWFDMHPLDGIEVPPYIANDLDDIPKVGLAINDLPMMPTTEWAMESGEWKKIIQAYLACISYVDHEIGRVLQALKSSSYKDNTVIVLWSDHGYRLGEKNTFAKHALWESATKAPLIFSAPFLPKGVKINSPVEMISIYPTLLELCGLPPYKRNEGASLVPLMQGRINSANTFALTTYGKNNHAVRSDRYRYISYEDGTEEFYDHKSDPNEWTNEAKNEKYKKAKDALKIHLPTINTPWDKNSSYSFQPYFKDQKAMGDSVE